MAAYRFTAKVWDQERRKKEKEPEEEEEEKKTISPLETDHAKWWPPTDLLPNYNWGQYRRRMEKEEEEEEEEEKEEAGKKKISPWGTWSSGPAHVSGSGRFAGSLAPLQASRCPPHNASACGDAPSCRSWSSLMTWSALDDSCKPSPEGRHQLLCSQNTGTWRSSPTLTRSKHRHLKVITNSYTVKRQARDCHSIHQFQISSLPTAS